MFRSIRLFSFFILALGFLTPFNVAKATQSECGKKLSASKHDPKEAKRKSNETREDFVWDVVTGNDGPIFILSNVDPAVLDQARELAKEIVGYASLLPLSSLDSYGDFPSDHAALRTVLWGGLFAFSAALTYWLPADSLELLRWGSRGIAFLSCLKALRWMCTLDGSLTREEGLPEANLWGALGPIKRPLATVLQSQAIDATLSAAFFVSTSTLDRVLDWYRGRDLSTAVPPLDIVVIPIRNDDDSEECRTKRKRKGA